MITENKYLRFVKRLMERYVTHYNHCKDYIMFFLAAGLIQVLFTNKVNDFIYWAMAGVFAVTIYPIIMILIALWEAFDQASIENRLYETKVIEDEEDDNESNEELDESNEKLDEDENHDPDPIVVENVIGEDDHPKSNKVVWMHDVDKGQYQAFSKLFKKDDYRDVITTTSADKLVFGMLEATKTVTNQDAPFTIENLKLLDNDIDELLLVGNFKEEEVTSLKRLYNINNETFPYFEER